MVRAGAASVALHLAVILFAVLTPDLFSVSRPARRAVASLSRPTPLIAPPKDLTQTDPNRGRISKELNLEGLLPRPRIQVPPAPRSTTRPAAPVPSPVPIPEPPKVDTELARAAEPPLLGASPQAPPPPRIQPDEVPQPKLAFETPRAAGVPTGQPTGKLTPPSSNVDEASRVVIRTGRGGGLMVGDLGEGIGGVGEALNLPPSPGRAGSSLELLSDPMGVDFRPYLIRILSSVKRNWFAVMPESVRLGRRGRVQIQFAISRDGKVPKLVIAMPSGADALDRAAVAGISASNPFPPLPAEFRGEQIRLQFTFLYNLSPQ